MVTTLNITRGAFRQQLYDRKIGLTVLAASQRPGAIPQGTKGLDLSDMRIVFRVSAPDVKFPPTAQIRIYNLSNTTAKQIQNEFQFVILQAGYQSGPYGVIFQGQIKQVKKGRESAIDSYVDIYASDLDLLYNFGLINKNSAGNTDFQQQLQSLNNDVQKFGASINQDDINGLGGLGGILPRGKVQFGLFRDEASKIADSTNTVWSIQNGQIRFTKKRTGSSSGEAVVLNARTGLVMVPEATENGIEAVCLINPNIKAGTKVQINNADINSTRIVQQGFPSYTEMNFVASVTDDGFYQVLVVEHEGDSRGNPWYSRLTCLAIDNSTGQILGSRL
jgi:hypothetical protein